MYGLQAKIRQALQDLQRELCADVFCNPVQFRAGVKDFLPGSANELARNLLNRASDMDMYGRLQSATARDKTLTAHNLTKEMVRSHGVSEDLAQIVVSEMSRLLGTKTVAPAPTRKKTASKQRTGAFLALLFLGLFLVGFSIFLVVW